MHDVTYVKNLIQDGLSNQEDKALLAWRVALACEGWSYVFGGRGQECTPGNRRSMDYTKHPTIKSKCKNFDGTASCSGCEWYPNGSRTRFFDCRGFTYWVLLQVYGWKLMGGGATSQWNNVDNWSQKGLVADGIPRDTLVCLFYQNKTNPAVMQHTGFCLNDETIECGNGVTYNKSIAKKWTHWAIPRCVTAIEDMDHPTLRRGDKGQSVVLLQTLLKEHGYDLGPCGIDGDFGKATQKAVKSFQQDYGLTADGIVGTRTWEMLEDEKVKLYTVHIPGMTQGQAEALKEYYPEAWVTE